jgi:putative endonuclease
MGGTIPDHLNSISPATQVEVPRLGPSRGHDRRIARRSTHDMPDAWVYLLRCRDGSLYCGWTSDLDRRLRAHATGRASRYTASRLPVSLAFAQPMADRGAARREEARIKRLTRAQKLALVAAATAGV